MRLFLSALLLFLTLPLPAAEPPAQVFVPRRVKLDGTKRKLSAVLRDVGEQTGYVVQAADEVGDPDIDVNLAGVPFWQALDAIALQAGARPYLYGRDGKIRLNKAGKDTVPLVSHDGAFRVSLRRLTAINDFETGGRELTASLEVAWEPQVLPIYLDMRPVRLLLRDAQGNALTVKEQGSLLAPADNRPALQVDLPLPAAPRGDAKLALLQGELLLRAPSEMLTFKLGNLGELSRGKFPLVQQEKKTTCTVHEIKLGRTRWTVDVEVQLPEGGPTFESFQSWVVHNELYLVNTKERVRLSATSSELNDSSSRKARLSYSFDGKGAAPGKPDELLLIYRAPAAIAEVPIRFQFKDVPLP